MAPEVLQNKSYSFAVDFWAAGVTIFTMLLGRPPWCQIRNECKRISSICFSPLPRCIAPYYARMFLHRMLAKDPKHRLTYNQMIHHPFFSDIDWTAIGMRKAARPNCRVTRKVREDEQSKSVEFSQGSRYTHDYDPYPTFTWLSSAMADRRASFTVYKARMATMHQIRRYLDCGKRIMRIRVHPHLLPTHLEIASQTDAAARHRAEAFEVLFGRSSSSCDTPYRTGYPGLCRELNEVPPAAQRVRHVIKVKLQAQLFSFSLSLSYHECSFANELRHLDTSPFYVSQLTLIFAGNTACSCFCHLTLLISFNSSAASKD
ncbi:hypothetical protein PISMIDRAFT_20304 [Pisolithus microcarpus 441]|uniref:Protein kinase domain-containing protein n=1 Tax=Pisolithus microcarpus 441 TaxID=765257 RepID=A0A0C9YRA1_9AGAM|nr:hypothetical protein PISMIDRAFT_20304 [Pisolithus microcarpus 441]